MYGELRRLKNGTSITFSWVGRQSTNTNGSYELRNRPRSTWSLCGSVVEHLSAESEGLRCDSSWGLPFFFLCPKLVTKRKKTSFSIFKRNHTNFFQFLDFKRGASSSHELYKQVVTENSYTLFLTRPIGSPVISTDPPDAFILGIPEKT